jgi:hypothetical protein
MKPSKEAVLKFSEMVTVDAPPAIPTMEKLRTNLRAQTVPAGRDSPLCELMVMFLECALAHAGPMPAGYVVNSDIDDVGLRMDDGTIITAKLSGRKVDELLDLLVHTLSPLAIEQQAARVALIWNEFIGEVGAMQTGQTITAAVVRLMAGQAIRESGGMIRASATVGMKRPAPHPTHTPPVVGAPGNVKKGVCPIWANGKPCWQHRQNKCPLSHGEDGGAPPQELVRPKPKATGTGAEGEAPTSAAAEE